MVQTQITTVINEMLLTWLKQVPPTELPQRATPELTATVMSWSIYGAAFYWSQEDREESLDEFVPRTLVLVTIGSDTASIEKR